MTIDIKTVTNKIEKWNANLRSDLLTRFTVTCKVRGLWIKLSITTQWKNKHNEIKH